MSSPLRKIAIEEVCFHPAYVGKDRRHRSRIKKIELWKGNLCRVLNSVEFILQGENTDEELMKHGYNDFTGGEDKQFWWRGEVLV